MRKSQLFIVANSTLLVAGLSGCAVDSTRISQSENKAALERSGQFQVAARQPQQVLPLIVEDAQPRFARRSIPLQRAASLPPTIGKITLRYPGRHSLSAVANQISRLIDVPVLMTADALAGAGAYAPGNPPSSTTATAQQGSASAQKPAETIQVAGARPLLLTPDALQNTLELNYSGSLSGLLDEIAARAQLQWEYREGKIIFSRVVTRSIALKSLPKGLTAKGTLDMMDNGGTDSGGGSGGGGGGGLSVAYDMESDHWAGLADSLKGMTSSQALIQVDPRSGFVTVTDAITNVERIESYLQALNTQLLRQVTIELEVLQVTMSDQYSNGIDWNAIAGKLSDTTNSISFNSPSSLGPLSNNQPGVLSMVLGGNSHRGKSEFFVRALQEYGQVSTAYSTVVTTTNRMPIPLGATATEAYLRQTTAPTTNSTNGNVITPGGLSPGSVSTGFSMLLTPVILDSNRILLQSVMQISALKGFKTFTSGSGNLSQSLQLPTVQRFSSLQRTSVKAGETLILVGYENEQTQTDNSDVVRNALPMARRGGRTKQGTVILITPRLNES